MHIGLVGHKGAGKNLAADIIKQQWGTFEQFAFADPLKRIATTIFGITEAEMTDRKLKEETLERYPFQSPRQILQQLGTEAVRAHWPEAWTEAWKRAIDAPTSSPDTVTTDVRFSNEAEAIREKGGFLIRIVRPPTGQEIADPTKYVDKHASETVQDGIVVDKVVVNDGSMILLTGRIITAVAELMEGKGDSGSQVQNG